MKTRFGWRFAPIISLVLAACSSDEARGSAGELRTVDCRQKADADNSDDCFGHPDQPRKLDCDAEDQTNDALAAGCVPEKEGGSDVCCPNNVSGQKETMLTCTEPSDTLTDSDCAGTSHPRKLNCASSDEQQKGIAAGCVPEDPGEVTDYDLCCPGGVRGVH